MLRQLWASGSRETASSIIAQRLSIQLVLEPQQSLILVVKDELGAKASPCHSVRSDASDQGQLRDLTHSDPAQDRE